MRYTTVLIDLDHCLLDSDASEDEALRNTFQIAGVAHRENHSEIYRRINDGLWNAVERGEMSPNDVRYARFRHFVDETGVDADPVEMADLFVEGLGRFGRLYPGAEVMLEMLSRQATLGLVTNGIGEVQRRRISRLGLDRYFSAYVISGEAGVAKPDPRIFETISDMLGNPAGSTMLMVGDSLTSDMAGGANFGIDTCWYNPHGRIADGTKPTHEIRDLRQLLEVAGA